MIASNKPNLQKSQHQFWLRAPVQLWFKRLF